MSEHLWRDLSSDSDDGQGWLIVREPPQEDVAEAVCPHPRLYTLPIAADRLYGIVCTSCGKHTYLRYDKYVQGTNAREFCIAAFIKETFGDAWGRAAAKTCPCRQCKEGASV